MRQTQASTAPQARLRNFPISFFAVVMGLGGLTIAWQRAAGGAAGGALLALTAIVFALLASLYAAKALRHPDSVLEEFRHPVRLNFVPAVSIGRGEICVEEK